GTCRRSGPGLRTSFCLQIHFPSREGHSAHRSAKPRCHPPGSATACSVSLPSCQEWPLTALTFSNGSAAGRDPHTKRNRSQVYLDRLCRSAAPSSPTTAAAAPPFVEPEGFAFLPAPRGDEAV